MSEQFGKYAVGFVIGYFVVAPLLMLAIGAIIWLLP